MKADCADSTTRGNTRKRSLIRRFAFPPDPTVSPCFPVVCRVGVGLEVAQRHLPDPAYHGTRWTTARRSFSRIFWPLAVPPILAVYRGPMSDPAVRLRLLLDAARRRWQTDDGGVAARELVAIAAVALVAVAAAVAILEVVGVDMADWMREQLGIASSG